MLSWLFSQLKVDEDPLLETATDPGASPAGSSDTPEASGSRKRREPPTGASDTRVRLFLSFSRLVETDSIFILCLSERPLYVCPILLSLSWTLLAALI